MPTLFHISYHLTQWLCNDRRATHVWKVASSNYNGSYPLTEALVSVGFG